MELKDINIERLMDLAVSGDNDAFKEIYKYFFTPVYKYVLIRTKRDDLAKDISQTVFLKSFENIKRYKYQGKSPLAYFFTVAKNEIINEWRKTRKTFNYSQEEIKSKFQSEENIERNTENKLQKDKIFKYLGLLTDEQKELISLKFISGLNNNEISEITGKSEEAVRQLQFRALKALKDLLRNE